MTGKWDTDRYTKEPRPLHTASGEQMLRQIQHDERSGLKELTSLMNSLHGQGYVIEQYQDEIIIKGKGVKK